MRVLVIPSVVSLVMSPLSEMWSWWSTLVRAGIDSRDKLNMASK